VTTSVNNFHVRQLKYLPLGFFAMMQGINKTWTSPEVSREVEVPRFPRQLALEGGNFVSLTHPQEVFLVLISVRG
jgi:hypothetical protein